VGGVPIPVERGICEFVIDPIMHFTVSIGESKIGDLSVVIPGHMVHACVSTHQDAKEGPTNTLRMNLTK
jgi:hypothetical protein